MVFGYLYTADDLPFGLPRRSGKMKLHASFLSNSGSPDIILDCLLCIDSESLTPAQKEWVQQEYLYRLSGKGTVREPPYGWLKDWKDQLYNELGDATVAKRARDPFSGFAVLKEVLNEVRRSAPGVATTSDDEIIKVLLEDFRSRLQVQQEYLGQVARRNFRLEYIERWEKFPGDVFSVSEATGVHNGLPEWTAAGKSAVLAVLDKWQAKKGTRIFKEPVLNSLIWDAVFRKGDDRSAVVANIRVRLQQVMNDAASVGVLLVARYEQMIGNELVTYLKNPGTWKETYD